MKTLLVLRHAKSSWKDASLADHDRPLNGRGRRDAPRVGRRLRNERLVPQLIVSSTAKRARATAERVAEACGADGIDVEGSLYHAGAEDILDVVRACPDDHDRVMIVGHNPGLEDFVAWLGGGYETMPTSALARFEIDVERWADAAPGAARLAELWRVKEMREE